MELNEIIDELKSLGTERTKKIYLRKLLCHVFSRHVSRAKEND
jgi:hypothetical protein